MQPQCRRVANTVGTRLAVECVAQHHTSPACSRMRVRDSGVISQSNTACSWVLCDRAEWFVWKILPPDAPDAPSARPKRSLSPRCRPAAPLHRQNEKKNVAEKVRRKLAASLRGKGSYPRPPSPSSPAGGGGAAAAGRGDGGAEGEVPAAGALADGGTIALNLTVPDEAAPHPFQVNWDTIFTGPEENVGSAAARAEAKVRRRGQAGGLDSPLVLTGAMEVLGTALVVLPAGDTEGARHCVG